MDAESFKSQYFGFHPKLYRVAFALVGNEADAEDLLQEVYAKLWKMRDNLADVRSPEAFAVTMTKNACLDFLRSPAGRKNRTEIDRLPVTAEEQPPDRKLEALDLLGNVRKLIDRLPENQRQILRLRAMDDHSLEEIAEMTGFSPGNVRTMLSRARKTLREQMTNDYSYE